MDKNTTLVKSTIISNDSLANVLSIAGAIIIALGFLLAIILILFLQDYYDTVERWAYGVCLVFSGSIFGFMLMGIGRVIDYLSIALEKQTK